MAHPLELLQDLPRGEPVALLFGGGWGQDLLCSDVVDVLTLPAGAWRGAWARLDEFVRRHAARTCAGWLGYDLGLDVEAWPLALADDFPVPVLHVAAFASVRATPPVPAPRPPALAPATPLRPHPDRADHDRRVAAVV